MKLYNITACLVFLLVAACSKGQVETPLSENYVSLPISLQIIETSLQARSYANEVDECHINTLQVFLFEDTENGEIFSKEIEITDLNTALFEGNVKTFSGYFPEDDKQYRIVFIIGAQWPIYPENYPKQKKEFLDQITLEIIDFDWTIGKHRWPMPMWGESDILYNFKKSTAINTIQVIRSFARLDVLYQHSQVFDLKKIIIKNYSKKARLAPYDHVMDRELRKVTDVSLLDDEETDEMYIYINYYTGSSEGEILLAEFVNNGKAVEKQMQLIVGGHYNLDNDITYYYIPLIDKTTQKEFDILRNHKYTVRITGIDGPGYDEPEDALAAGLLTRSSAGSGIRYEITVE